LSHREIARQLNLLFPNEIFEVHNTAGASHSSDQFNIKPENNLHILDTEHEKELKNSCEIATPVWSQNLAIKNFKTIIKWLRITGAQTFCCCGIHVNISFKNMTENTKISRLKLVLLHNDEDLLRYFGRSNNPYCQNTFSQALRWIDANSNMSPEMLKCALLRRIYNNLSSKRWSIRLSQDLIDCDFNPQDDSCYVEFRALGGHNYQYKLNDLVHGIYQFIQTIRKSVDPDTDSNLYNIIQYYRKKSNKKDRVQKSVSKGESLCI